jgi:hypothetical protein
MYQKKKMKPPTIKNTFHVGSKLVRLARIDPPIVEIIPAYSAIPWAYIIPVAPCPLYFNNYTTPEPFPAGEPLPGERRPEPY